MPILIGFPQPWNTCKCVVTLGNRPCWGSVKILILTTGLLHTNVFRTASKFQVKFTHSWLCLQQNDHEALSSCGYTSRIQFPHHTDTESEDDAFHTRVAHTEGNVVSCLQHRGILNGHRWLPNASPCPVHFFLLITMYMVISTDEVLVLFVSKYHVVPGMPLEDF